jgi:hypothetical protein
MDPKLIANMDPKLRETYERVMGTAAASSPLSAPPPSNGTSNQLSQSLPIQQPEIPTPMAPPATEELSSQLVTPVTPPTPAPTPVDATSTMFQPLPSPASVNQEAQTNETSFLLRILYIVGGIIFFILYAIFWIKILKLNFPF